MSTGKCLLDVYGRFWKLCGAVTRHNWASGDVVRVAPFSRYVFTMLNGKILNKYNESSLTGAHILVKLTT